MNQQIGANALHSQTDLLRNASVEVTPRALARLDDISVIPRGTRVFIAHIPGTALTEMTSTARALRDAGLDPVPHIPARHIRDRAELADWLQAYRDAGDVRQALLIAGGQDRPVGDLTSSQELIDSGLFDRMSFTNLFFAGHPEAHPVIDRDGSTRMTDAALQSKQAYAQWTDARVALVTQFVFDAAPVIKWAERLRWSGIDLPITVGLAGPAKLQSLIRYGLECGVGPSVKVLQRRAKDLRKLLRPVTPDEVLADLQMRASGLGIESVHFFPFGGIAPSMEWLSKARQSTL